MEPYFTDSSVTLWHGDALEVLCELPDASVDAVVTDPPYNLTAGKKGGTGAASVNLESPYGRARIGTGNGSGGFMGQAWDDYDDFAGGFQAWCEAWATECLRVLKPGGHMLAFGGSRTWHRLAAGIEDAGFEIRDSIAWLYGSGFPKSLDVSKAIDKAAGAEREVVGDKLDRPGYHLSEPGKTNGVLGMGHGLHVDPEARLKAAQITAPATDDARQWQGWGTALKPAFEPIVVARKPLAGTVADNVLAHGTGALNIDACRIDTGGEQLHTSTVPNDMRGGHYGAGHRPGESSAQRRYTEQGATDLAATPGPRGGDLAKADASERVRVNGVAHPTVKPLELMRWLARLVTPPGGLVLEPFAGSGTTVEACLLEGMRCVAIEREADYLPLIRQRIDRRRDPVAAIVRAGDDAGLFGLLDEGGVA